MRVGVFLHIMDHGCTFCIFIHSLIRKTIGVMILLPIDMPEIYRPLPTLDHSRYLIVHVFERSIFDSKLSRELFHDEFRVRENFDRICTEFYRSSDPHLDSSILCYIVGRLSECVIQSLDRFSCSISYKDTTSSDSWISSCTSIGIDLVVHITERR